MLGMPVGDVLEGESEFVFEFVFEGG